MSVEGAYQRDENFVPIIENGIIVNKSITLSANNTTAAVPLFTVKGDVEVLALYGVVTTALSSAVTTAYWRLNDGTAQAAISLATGTTLSSFTAGSFLIRRSLVSVALSATNASAGAVVDPVAATAPDIFMPFTVIQKTGNVTTNIEFVYTTTNTPASGAITFYLGWVPLSDGSYIEAL
jgi:hypothetical protein